jgi:hypothetical protein
MATVAERVSRPRTPVSRGTEISNPVPSTGESRANLSFRAGIASILADAVLRKAIGEQALAMLRSFRKQGTVEQVGLGDTCPRA